MAHKLHFNSSRPCSIRLQHGFSLIALIGTLAIISIGVAVAAPALLQTFNQQDQEIEEQLLHRIAEGIELYLKEQKAYPPSLANLVPDYVPFALPQVTANSRGFPRYYAVHPGMNGFNNSIGLFDAELVNARFLLLSDLSQDLAPTIATPAQFDTWWTTNETLNQDLHIHRGNIGHLFFSFAITPEGNGASYFVSNNPPTDSGGGLLPAHNAFHLVGTLIGLDENTFYAVPEVQFALTTNTAYWFDPQCAVTQQWNPLDPTCASALGMVRDEFTAIAFNGNNGPQNWANDWQEAGEADGPTAGKMQVVTNTQCATGNCFQFGGGGGGPSTTLSREVDVTGATSVTLTFSYRRGEGKNGGSIRLEVFDVGAGAWTNLQSYNMNSSDATQIPQTFDLTAYIAPNLQIRFARNGNVKRFFYADNIEITWN